MDYILDVHMSQRKSVLSKQSKQRASLAKAVTAAIKTHLGPAAVSKEPLPAPTAEPPSSLPPLSPTSHRSHASTLPVPGYAPPAVGSAATVADVAVLQREEAAQVWTHRERYTIQAAFTNQLARIEAEWKEYLVSMHSEWEDEYKAITGHAPDQAAVAATGVDVQALKSGSGDPPKSWLDKAKQEQLIHTAPVIMPSGAGAMRRGAAPSAPTAPSTSLSATAKRQVAELATKYANARASVKAQQAEVARWVQRQCRRMLMQVDGAGQERAAVAAAEAKLAASWADVATLLYNAAVTVSRSSGTPLQYASTTDTVAYLREWGGLGPEPLATPPTPAPATSTPVPAASPPPTRSPARATPGSASRSRQKGSPAATSFRVSPVTTPGSRRAGGMPSSAGSGSGSGSGLRGSRRGVAGVAMPMARRAGGKR